MARRFKENSMDSLYDFEALQMNGQSVPLRQYGGKVLLISQHSQRLRLHAAVWRA